MWGGWFAVSGRPRPFLPTGQEPYKPNPDRILHAPIALAVIFLIVAGYLIYSFKGERTRVGAYVLANTYFCLSILLWTVMAITGTWI